MLHNTTSPPTMLVKLSLPLAVALSSPAPTPAPPCPCANRTLCDPITRTGPENVYAFHTTGVSPINPAACACHSVTSRKKDTN